MATFVVPPEGSEELAAELRSDDDVARFLAGIGLPGLIDLRVHFLPPAMQEKVWQHFDRFDPAWPITYRLSDEERLAVLRRIGAVRHGALAYAHRPGMSAWLNDYTLALAAGGALAKVHLQVGQFAPTDPRTFRLLYASLAAVMGDSAGRISAYRMVLRFRRPDGSDSGRPATGRRL